MRIQDMVLVIENTKGSEKNMLMTVKEYKEAYLFVSSLSRETGSTMSRGSMCFSWGSPAQLQRDGLQSDGARAFPLSGTRQKSIRL